MSSDSRRWIAAVVFAGLLQATLLSGQTRDEFGDVTQTVARISYIDGSVSFARGDDPDNWQSADRNVPMTVGDRVYTGDRSRVELQVQGGEFIRLGSQTDLAAMNLTDDTKQFSVKVGIASFQVRRLSSDDVFEIDTPNAAVTLEQPGDYRIDVDESGNSKITVRRGRATVAAGGGQVPLQEGQGIDIQGVDSPSYDIVAVSPADGWDQWAQGREGRMNNAASNKYVSDDVVGVDDLDEYGQWQDVPGYGRVWAPAAVAADWVPYREGHWIWQDPWGWTWVSGEPWGWAPYHYGRWVVASSRWYWVPVAPAIRVAAYSPALVAFVGGGPVAVNGGGFVGWFPLGPRDPFNRWWGRPASPDVNVTNTTYVNRSYVTVVNQNTFVSGGIVTQAFVTDRAVLQQVGIGPIARGPLPWVPTAGALHVAVRANLPAPPRPSALILNRAVVARIAPPPAPPSFQSKIAVIRQNRGAPVGQVEAARMSVQSSGAARSVTTVRAVTADSGQMTLKARGHAAESSAAKPQPVASAPLRGRAIATSQQPVAAAPAPTTGARGREVAPAPPSAGSVAPSNQGQAGSAADSTREREGERRNGNPVPSPAISRASPNSPAQRQNRPADNSPVTMEKSSGPVNAVTAPPSSSDQGNGRERERITPQAQPSTRESTSAGTPPRANRPAEPESREAVPTKSEDRQPPTKVDQKQEDKSKQKPEKTKQIKKKPTPEEKKKDEGERKSQ